MVLLEIVGPCTHVPPQPASDTLEMENPLPLNDSTSTAESLAENVTEAVQVVIVPVF
jgi:hypothetical protein